MRIETRAGIALALLTILAACGSYSAPNNTRMSPDSTGDTTMHPPPNYSRN
jgi:hypothetical protein